MAKSPLQVADGSYKGIVDSFTKKITSGPSRSLELDFLRLVYATNQLIKKGNDVKAYLMVTTPEIVNRLKQWNEKYEVEAGLINMVHANLNQDEIEILVNEKTRNKTANIANAKNRKTNARADSGRDLLEYKLVNHIEQKHGKGEVISIVKEMPFQINWDYCRVVTGKIKVS